MCHDSPDAAYTPQNALPDTSTDTDIECKQYSYSYLGDGQANHSVVKIQALSSGVVVLLVVVIVFFAAVVLVVFVLKSKHDFFMYDFLAGELDSGGLRNVGENGFQAGHEKHHACHQAHKDPDKRRFGEPAHRPKAIDHERGVDGHRKINGPLEHLQRLPHPIYAIGDHAAIIVEQLVPMYWYLVLVVVVLL